MEKLFFVLVILYALFVSIYFLVADIRKKRKRDVMGEGGAIRDAERPQADIVGKSRFTPGASKPLAATGMPIDATPEKSDNPSDNPGIFAPPNEGTPPAKIPAGELDAVFSDTESDEGMPPEGEANEPMDIDYPLEFESDEEEENREEEEDEEEDESEELEGMAGAALASGVGFEDLVNAIRTVNRVEEATREQRQRAGGALLEIRQTDMFEQVVSGKPDARQIVTDLISETLNAFHRRKDREEGNTGSGRKAPESFNIRDFA